MLVSTIAVPNVPGAFAQVSKVAIPASATIEPTHQIGITKLLALAVGSTTDRLAVHLILQGGGGEGRARKKGLKN